MKTLKTWKKWVACLLMLARRGNECTERMDRTACNGVEFLEYISGEH